MGGMTSSAVSGKNWLSELLASANHARHGHSPPARGFSYFVSVAESRDRPSPRQSESDIDNNSHPSSSPPPSSSSSCVDVEIQAAWKIAAGKETNCRCFATERQHAVAQEPNSNRPFISVNVTAWWTGCHLRGFISMTGHLISVKLNSVRHFLDVVSFFFSCDGPLMCCLSD